MSEENHRAYGYQDEKDIRLHIPYVFGSSCPRDLSYLDFLPAKFRVYNTRLRSAKPTKDEPTLSDYLRQARSASPTRRRDRSVDSGSRFYVFGSSTPRELSYLDNIPAEFRVYDVKLGSASRHHDKRSKTTSFSSTGSGGNGRQAVGRRTSSLNMLANSPNADDGHRLVRSSHDNASDRMRRSTSSRSSRKGRTPPPAASSQYSSFRSKSTTPKTSAQQSGQVSPVKSEKNGDKRHIIKAQRIATTPVSDKKKLLINGGSASEGRKLLSANAEPLEVRCADSPTSHEITFDGASPISDEFVIMPAIALLAETGLGLTEMHKQTTHFRPSEREKPVSPPPSPVEERNVHYENTDIFHSKITHGHQQHSPTSPRHLGRDDDKFSPQYPPSPLAHARISEEQEQEPEQTTVVRQEEHREGTATPHQPFILIESTPSVVEESADFGRVPQENYNSRDEQQDVFSASQPEVNLVRTPFSGAHRLTYAGDDGLIDTYDSGVAIKSKRSTEQHLD